MSKINYDLKLIKAVIMDVDGVLSPATIPMDNNGMPCRMMNVKDGYAIQLAIKHGIKIAIITGADSENIKKRYRALGVTDIYTKAKFKLPILLTWLKENQINPDEVAFIGDDIPDYECMRHVGLSVAPADASIDIKMIAQYISPTIGGYGVARDLLEEIMRAQNIWVLCDKSFGW